MKKKDQTTKMVLRLVRVMFVIPCIVEESKISFNVSYLTSDLFFNPLLAEN